MVRLTTGNKSKMLSRCYIFLIFLGLSIILIACEPQNYPDRIFVTGQGCAAPCWYGLVPDESTESEAMEKLKELPFVDRTSIKQRIDPSVSDEDHTNAVDILFYCVPPSANECGRFIIEGAVLKYIILLPQYPLQLKSVVDQLGQPDYQWSQPASPHGDGCYISIHWPQKGISIIAISGEFCNSLFRKKGLPPDLQIQDLQFASHDKEAAENAACAAFGCGTWPGFLDK